MLVLRMLILFTVSISLAKASLERDDPLVGVFREVGAPPSVFALLTLANVEDNDHNQALAREALIAIFCDGETVGSEGVFPESEENQEITMLIFEAIVAGMKEAFKSPAEG